MRRAVIVLALLWMCSSAIAGPKKRQVARLLSGAAAGVSGAVVLGGFLLADTGDAFNKPVLYTGLGLLAITPSAGELYANQYLTIGMGIRVVGAGLAYWTLQSQTELYTCELATMRNGEQCEELTENAAPLLGIAAIIYIGGTWYDILDAGDAADRYNARNGFTAMPTALAAPHGLVPGLAVGGTF